MTLLVLYVCLALGVSFLCSVLEAVLLSVTPAYIAVAQQEGNPVGQHFGEFKRDIDRPLAAILSLNTIAHTVGAAGAGAQAAVVFASVPMGVISGALTLAILVLSEIIPKTLGAVHWKRLAPVVARTLVPIIWTMWPLVKMAQGISHLLSPGEKGASVSREELAALAELGNQEGVLKESESRIMHNLLRFGSLSSQSIMTPRVVVFSLPESTIVDEVVKEQELRFSRIPVHTKGHDEMSGYVLKQDILLAAARGEGSKTLGDLKRTLIAVPTMLPLPGLLERLLNERDHIALVVDEFGGTAGVVTMEDVVETLLGLEIMDELDSVEDMQQLARQKWVERARKLGLVTGEEGSDQDEAVARWGLTGPKPPSD